MTREVKSLRSSVSLAVLALAMLNHQAYADLKACSSPGPLPTYKIFVDDVKSTGSAAANAAQLKDLTGLRDFVVSDLTTIAGGQASVRKCDNRFPVDSGDFDDSEVDSLDNMRVLLEVWASAQGAATGQGLLGFVLVPAWKPSLHTVYVVRRAGPNFLTQAKRGTELRVFAPLSIGIRTYKNQDYAAAIAPLCQGITELQTLLSHQAPGADPVLQANETSLLTSARQIASDAIAKARTPGSRFVLLKPDSLGNFACPAL